AEQPKTLAIGGASGRRITLPRGKKYAWLRNLINQLQGRLGSEQVSQQLAWLHSTAEYANDDGSADIDASEFGVPEPSDEIDSGISLSNGWLIVGYFLLVNRLNEIQQHELQHLTTAALVPGADDGLTPTEAATAAESVVLANANTRSQGPHWDRGGSYGALIL